jgi:hypothetical protein
MSIRAFLSELDAGSREENATGQRLEHFGDSEKRGNTLEISQLPPSADAKHEKTGHPCRFMNVSEYESGAARGIRTPDPLITNEVLYQLSYCGDGWGCISPTPI